MRDRLAVLLLRTGFFVAVLLAVLVAELLAVDFPFELSEWVERSEEVAGDCEIIQGTIRNSDSTPASQREARRAEKIRGSTTIMFSL